MHSKSEVFDAFQKFKAYVENQFSTRIKVLRSDSGGEYMSHQFQNFPNTHDILSQRSCPYTPQQNEVAEWKNRHLLDTVRSLLLESSVPAKFWLEALATAVYLINHLPSPRLSNQTPYFRLFHTDPTYTHLRIFDCMCFVHLPPFERTKLSAQSAQCAFLGYASHKKGYICYDHVLNCIRISQNVIFFENQRFFPNHPKSLPSFSHLLDFTGKISSPLVVYERHRHNDVPLLPPPPDPSPAPDLAPTSSHAAPLASSPVQLRRSTCLSKPPDKYGFTHTSLLATLSSIAIHDSYSRRRSMIVGIRLCKKN